MGTTQELALPSEQLNTDTLLAKKPEALIIHPPLASCPTLNFQRVALISRRSKPVRNHWL